MLPLSSSRLSAPLLELVAITECLYAEHTEDAKARPGAHPNIDRLLDVIASGKGYAVTVIAA